MVILELLSRAFRWLFLIKRAATMGECRQMVFFLTNLILERMFVDVFCALVSFHSRDSVK